MATLKWHGDTYELITPAHQRFIPPQVFCWMDGTKTKQLLNKKTNFVAAAGVYPFLYCPKCKRIFYLDVWGNPHTLVVKVEEKCK